MTGNLTGEIWTQKHAHERLPANQLKLGETSQTSEADKPANTLISGF